MKPHVKVFHLTWSLSNPIVGDWDIPANLPNCSHVMIRENTFPPVNDMVHCQNLYILFMRRKRDKIWGFSTDIIPQARKNKLYFNWQQVCSPKKIPFFSTHLCTDVWWWLAEGHRFSMNAGVQTLYCIIPLERNGDGDSTAASYLKSNQWPDLNQIYCDTWIPRV